MYAESCIIIYIEKLRNLKTLINFRDITLKKSVNDKNKLYTVNYLYYYDIFLNIA